MIERGQMRAGRSVPAREGVVGHPTGRAAACPTSTGPAALTAAAEAPVGAAMEAWGGRQGRGVSSRLWST